MTIATSRLIECHPETAKATKLPTMYYGIERGVHDGREGFTWYVSRGKWKVSGWCQTHAIAQRNVDRAKALVDGRDRKTYSYGSTANG